MPMGSSWQIEDDWVIDFPTEFQSRPGSSSSLPRRRVDANIVSAESFLHRMLQIISSRKDVLRRSRIKENWVHSIPLVVLLSLFILWWFSYPVDFSIKQGGVTEALRMVIQPELNATRDQKVELAILASAALTPIWTTSPDRFEHKPNRTAKHHQQMNLSLGTLYSDHTTKVSTLSRSMLSQQKDFPEIRTCKY